METKYITSKPCCLNHFATVYWEKQLCKRKKTFIHKTLFNTCDGEKKYHLCSICFELFKRVTHSKLKYIKQYEFNGSNSDRQWLCQKIEYSCYKCVSSEWIMLVEALHPNKELRFAHQKKIIYFDSAKITLIIFACILVNELCWLG